MPTPYGLHKRGHYWWVDFQVAGERIHRSTRRTSYPEALEVAAEWFKEARDKSEGKRSDSDITLEDLWGRWYRDTEKTLSKSHRDGVETWWRLYILPALGHRKARTITNGDAAELRRVYLEAPSLTNLHQERPGDDEATQERRASSRKPHTISGSNKLLLAMHLVFAWAVEECLLLQVPWTVALMEDDPKPKYMLEQHQIKPFLAAVDFGTSQHARVMVRAMLYLGIREIDARRMRWEDFNPDLTIYQQTKTKTKRTPAPKPIPADLQHWLLKLRPEIEGKPATEGFVFPAEDGAQHRQQVTRKAIERGASAVGLQGRLSPHRMRGSFATMLARAGQEAHLIQRALDHGQLQTSNDYVKLRTKDLAQAYTEVFGELFTGTPPKTTQIKKQLIARYRKKVS